jgi:hypothetical protein
MAWRLVEIKPTITPTATLPWGDRSPRFPMVGYPDALVAKRGMKENNRAGERSYQ